MNQGDVLAIRAVMQNVSRTRSDIRSLRGDLREMRNENQRAARAHKGLADSITRSYDAAGKSHSRAITQTRALNTEAGKLKSTFSALKGLVASVGIPIGIMGAAKAGMFAIQKFEGKQGAGRAFAFNFGAEVSKKVMADLDRFSDTQGLSRLRTRSSGLALAGSRNVKPGDLMPVMRGFAALGAVGGATSEQQNRAFEQLAQIASQGQLQGDELRQIAENLVPIRSLLIQAGFGARMGSQSNPITWKEVQDTLIKFGKSGDVAGMLAAQANNATASLQRLQNILEDDIAPVIGDVLSPALKEVAEDAKEWAKSLDPQDIKEKTRQIVGFARALVNHAPAIAGIYVGLKAYQTLLGGRYLASTYAAANALDTLAASAYAAAGRGGGGGGGSFGGGGGYGGFGGGSGGSIPAALPNATKGGAPPFGMVNGQIFRTPKGRASGWFGGKIGRGIRGAGRAVGIGIGGIGGGLLGQKIGESVSDNPLVQMVFSMLGSAGGAAGASKLMSLGGGAGLGGGAMGMAGGAGVGVILSELALLGMAGSEAASGKLGTADSFFTRWFLNGNGVGGFGGGFNPANRNSWDAKQKSIEAQRLGALKMNGPRQAAKRYLGQRMPWLRKKNGAVDMMDVLRYSWDLPVDMQQALAASLTGDQLATWKQLHTTGGHSKPSPRAAAYDSKSAEDASRTVRWSY